MPDRWTQATEQLVADELRGLVGMQFTDSDADNRAEQILTALADAGLLVEPRGDYLQYDCPGQDCRRHPAGQHTHSRYVGTWVPVEDADRG